MKIFVIALALAFAAPLSISAAQQSAPEKPKQAHHTQFPAGSNDQVKQTYGFGF